MAWEIERANFRSNMSPEWSITPQVSLTPEGVTFNHAALQIFGLKVGCILVVMTDMAANKIGIKVADPVEIPYGYALCPNGSKARMATGTHRSCRIGCKKVCEKMGITERIVRTPFFNQTQRIIEIDCAPVNNGAARDLMPT